MWTKEEVLRLIKERTAERLPLSYSVVVRDAEALTGVARRLFGSWGAAVEAAGLNYREIKKQARLTERYPVGYWSTQRIVEMIRAREVLGLPLNPHAVQNEDSKLYAAAAQYFGSWGKAMEAAGIDYLEHRKTRGWDAETIIQ